MLGIFTLFFHLCALSLQTVQNCVHVQDVFIPLCLSNVLTYESRLLPDLYTILLKSIVDFVSKIFQCQLKLLLISEPSLWWLSPEVYLCAGNSDTRAYSLGNWRRRILNNDLGPELQKLPYPNTIKEQLTVVSTNWNTCVLTHLCTYVCACMCLRMHVCVCRYVNV